MDAQADEAAVSGKRPADEAVPELAQRVMQLRNVVNMEREHADKLFALLIDTGSLSTDAERIAFLLNRGYEIDPDGKEFLFHAGALADDSEPAVPDGYRLRTAEPGDLEARVELHRIVCAVARHRGELYEASDRMAVSRRSRLRGGGAGRLACRFALYRVKQEGAERGIVYSLADSDATALY